MNGRDPETLTFSLEGLPRESGHVPLGSFLYQLRNFYEALNQTDRLISGAPEPTSRYRIVNMRHSSPASVSIGGRPKSRDFDITPEIFDGFVGALDQIRGTGSAPEWVDRDLLRSFRNLNRPVGRTVKAASVSRNGYSIDLDQELEAKIEVILAPVESFEGSIKGRLEAINLHADANTFRVYPAAGPNRVTCHFPDELRERAVSAVDRTVVVSGTLKYKANAPFPEEIYVEELEITPPDEELPKFSDLREIAPDATGDLSSLEHIRRVRDEWG